MTRQLVHSEIAMCKKSRKKSEYSYLDSIWVQKKLYKALRSFMVGFQ